MRNRERRGREDLTYCPGCHAAVAGLRAYATSHCRLLPLVRYGSDGLC